MRSELDETKVTAYALGELDDEERSAMEPLIAASEGTRREVEVQFLAGECERNEQLGFSLRGAHERFGAWEFERQFSNNEWNNLHTKFLLNL